MAVAVRQERRTYHPLMRPLSRLVLALTCNFHTSGRDNMPPPPFIAVANHLSYFDALAAAVASRYDAVALTAKKLQGGIIGWMMSTLGAPIYIEQASPDRQALKTALQYLRDGIPIAVAPEGTRSRNGQLAPGFEGTAYLVRKAGVPIVPVGFVGTHRILKVPRPDVEVRIGKPFTLPDLPGIDRAQQLKEDTARLMCSIAALLPESYHGAYTDHPYIEEMKPLVR